MPRSNRASNWENDMPVLILAYCLQQKIFHDNGGWEAVARCRTDAKAFIKRKEWAKAIECYNFGLTLCPRDAVFYCNRALCHIQLDEMEYAERDCTQALLFDTKYTLAHYRRAVARVGLKEYKAAKEDLDIVVTSKHGMKSAKSLLAEVEKNLEHLEPLNASGGESSNNVPVEKSIAEKLRPSSKVNKQNQQDKEIETTKDQNINEKIPDWLPEKDDVAIIEPIEKPAHLRPNRRAVKIPVTEVAFETGKSIKQADKPIPQTKPKVEEKPNVKIKKTEPPTNEIPPKPKTVIRLHVHTTQNGSLELRFKQMKIVSEDNIPPIFANSMEKDMFTNILRLLEPNFVPNGEPILKYLADFTKLSGFKNLLPFFNEVDKEGIRRVIDVNKRSEEASEEILDYLCEQYEL